MAMAVVENQSRPLLAKAYMIKREVQFVVNRREDEALRAL
jgi:hypothetical protein